MKTYLKVNIKSLAAEAKIIKAEEAKWKASKGGEHPIFLGLKYHRTGSLRSEARSALLAYGYLRGRSYHSMEAMCYDKPDWYRVAQKICSFGPIKDIKAVQSDLEVWSKGDRRYDYVEGTAVAQVAG